MAEKNDVVVRGSDLTIRSKRTSRKMNQKMKQQGGQEPRRRCQCKAQYYHQRVDRRRAEMGLEGEKRIQQKGRSAGKRIAIGRWTAYNCYENEKRPNSILTIKFPETAYTELLQLYVSTQAHAYRLTDVNVPLNSYILTSGNGAFPSIWWYDDQGRGGRQFPLVESGAVMET